jgi:hypothetical protein
MAIGDENTPGKNRGPRVLIYWGKTPRKFWTHSKKAMLGLPNGAIREMEATDLSQYTVVRLSERE